MQWLVYVHLVFAIALMAGALWLSIVTFRARPTGAVPGSVWKGLTHVDRLIGLQAVVGVILYFTVAHAKDPLHYLYGAVLLLAVLVEQALRPGRGLREVMTRDYGRFNEPMVYAILTFVMFLLAARGFTTGLWGF
ncbi:MAG: hypothetical protein M0Z54_00945 [Thermaerobacter sp.]|nr:hypothetical protein [Thermaerobacter sp.]